MEKSGSAPLLEELTISTDIARSAPPDRLEYNISIASIARRWPK
jgi:hypothetical protein